MLTSLFLNSFQKLVVFQTPPEAPPMNTVLPDLSVPPLTFFPSFADKAFDFAGSVLTLTLFFVLLVVLLLAMMLISFGGMPILVLCKAKA